MSRTPHDSPYRDDQPSPTAAPPRSSSQSRPARKSKRPRQQDHPRKQSQAHAREAARRTAGGAPQARDARGPIGSQASGGARNPNGARSANGARPPHTTRPAPDTRAHDRPHARGGPAPRKHTLPTTTATTAPAGRRRSRRRGRGGGGGPQIQLTSHPTGRAAYADTRSWLLDEHGAVCAYCAREFTAEVMTLDHVAPRRGQTAYDRRDNLVLACRPCNEAKRDLSPLAYLLAVRARAANLLRYGSHLSAGLLDLARSLLPKDHAGHATDAPDGANGKRGTHGTHGATAKRPAREIFGISDDDGESPYKD